MHRYSSRQPRLDRRALLVLATGIFDPAVQRLMARPFADLSNTSVVPDLVYRRVGDQGCAPICTFASQMTRISKDDPSFLIIHGDDDQTAPVSQSKFSCKPWTLRMFRPHSAAAAAVAVAVPVVRVSSR